MQPLGIPAKLDRFAKVAESIVTELIAWRSIKRYPNETLVRQRATNFNKIVPEYWSQIDDCLPLLRAVHAPRIVTLGETSAACYTELAYDAIKSVWLSATLIGGATADGYRISVDGMHLDADRLWENWQEIRQDCDELLGTCELEKLLPLVANEFTAAKQSPTLATAVPPKPINRLFPSMGDAFRMIAAEVSKPTLTAEPDKPPASETTKEPTGFLGVEELADKLGVHPTRKAAFIRQLGRKRISLDKDWIEVNDPQLNAPKFLYRADSPTLIEFAAPYTKPKSG